MAVAVKVFSQHKRSGSDQFEKSRRQNIVNWSGRSVHFDSGKQHIMPSVVYY
jgi:hypothetical protein